MVCALVRVCWRIYLCGVCTETKQCTMSRSVNLANATNSLTDTSARHHKVSRVCVDWYNSLTDPTVVSINKDDYRAIRFELALGIGRSFSELGYTFPDNRGLAPVFTNTAPMRGGNVHDDLMNWYVSLFDCRTVAERVAHVKTACTMKGQRFYPSELYFAGFCMCDAEAHPINGDTAVTMFIGGQITVRNGRYPVRCGERVQWYFEEEADAGLFDDDGNRKPRVDSGDYPPVGPAAVPVDGLNYAKMPLDAQSKKIRDHTYAERAQTKSLARIKPCREGIDGRSCTTLDVGRIFGEAKSGGEAYQMIDIKVCRQSH